MLAVLLLLAVAFVARYHDLVASRFLIQSVYTETVSLADRSLALRVASSIIGASPWQGVGAGNYLEAAIKLDPKADIVHNAPLLVAAELGLAGAVLWLWLVLASLWLPRGTKEAAIEVDGLRAPRRRNWTYLGETAPWLAYLTIGLFDCDAWPLAFMRSACLFALVVGRLTAPPNPFDIKTA